MKTLQDIGCPGKGNTGYDGRKGHNYLVVYDALFFRLKDKEISLLELGVHGGKSIEMWEQYFSKAKITGVDNWADGIRPTKQFEDRVRIMTANIDEKIGDLFPETFDVIIDDASHQLNHQMIAFEALHSKLREGGLYIIEDINSDQRRDLLVAHLQNAGFKTMVFDNRPYTVWPDSMMIVAHK